MVQKYQSPVRVYKYPFELVMAAYEKRFPTCKLLPVFLGSDVTVEERSMDGSHHMVERRCQLAVEAPYLLKKIAGVDCVYFIQRNELNLRKRTLKITAFNESFSSRVTINENCTYSVHPENPDWTCFEQDASLDIKHFFGFESTVEKIAMKQYSHNIKKGKEVIEFYINELISEGITYIAPWSNSTIHSEVVRTHREDAPSQDSGVRSRSDSASSVHSQASLVLGATAATMRRRFSVRMKENPAEPDGSLAPVVVDSPGKLDDDYIARFLGQLNLVEESRLIQLLQWLSCTHKEKIPKDAHILRFLRARDFNMEKAREMLVHSLAWRKLRNIDRLLENYTTPQVIETYYPGGWHYFDREGRPVYIMRLGQMDMKGIMRAVGEEALLKHVLAKNEEGLQLAAEATNRRGHPVSACTCIVDLDGLSMRHFWRPGIRALLRIIETVEANYPETMGRLLIVRAPRVFPVLWMLVSPFIDEDTRRKFVIYGSKDYLGAGGLEEFIDKEYIPDFLGGDCRCSVPNGSLVPKSLYDEDLQDRSQDELSALSSSSLYQTALIVKDFPHEVLIQVEHESSVIMWDFDILKGDVTFTMFRCRDMIGAELAHQHHVSGGAGGIWSVQYIGRSMVVGADLSIVEPPHICRDGDSLQGSHVTSQAGSYILQWKYFDSAKAPFDFPLSSSHKSKVMFYSELIASDTFRGSMNSLQSCMSGFSSLSVDTHQSSQSGKGSCPSRS